MIDETANGAPSAEPPSFRLPTWLLVLIPLPAICVGAIVSQRAGISPFAFVPNLAAFVLGAALIAIAPRCRPALRDPLVTIVALVATALIVRTLLSPGIQGVHRWLPLGPLRLHASMALAPWIAIAFARASHRSDVAHVRLVASFALTAQIAHLAQPDAQQAWALAIGLAPLLLLDRASPRWSRLVLAGSVALAVATLWRVDPLAPLPHVERILGLALAQGSGPFAFAAASLLLVLAPFALTASLADQRGRLALAGALWLVTQIVLTAVGAFPVPVIGAGAAGVLGVAGWLAALSPSEREGGERAGSRGSAGPSR